jgi:VCBS repeat-containing protein
MPLTSLRARGLVYLSLGPERWRQLKVFAANYWGYAVLARSGRAGIVLITLVALLMSVITARSPVPASAAPAPVQMKYACAAKSSGLMRYVSSPRQCTSRETAVTISPGPVHVCVYFNFYVVKVPSLIDCSPAVGGKLLTLPPTGGPVYFCVSDLTGALTYATGPGQCGGGQFPVVVPVAHQAPVLASIETSTLQYDAGTPAVPVTSTLTVSSATNSALASATVSITAGLDPADDVLSFTNQNGITGSYSASTGVLTLTGTASLANYQAALRSVRYQDSDALTAPGSRTVSFQVDDGAATGNLSNTVSRTIAVSTNQPPTAGNVSASTRKNAAIDIDVLTHASDPDGDTVSVASVDTTGTKGTVSVNGDGTIHYDPNGQFQGLTQGQTATDTFTYQVSDGHQTSGSATVTVTINGSNDLPVILNVETSPLSYPAQSPPTAVTSTLTISDDDDSAMSGATVSITAGLSADDDTLSFTDQNGITGSYTAATGVLTLAGAGSIADYRDALRSVKFSTSDNSASPAGRTVSFTVTDSTGATSTPAQRGISVSKAAPTAADVSASTTKNAATDIDVLSHATGPAGDTLAVASVDTTGTKGTVSVNGDGTIHYDPNGQFQSLTQGQTATDTFTYKVADGAQTSSSATVTVTINGVSDPPVISNVESSPLSYQAQSPPVAITSTLTISDDDDSTMSGATVSITAGFSSSDDLLSFTSQNGITGTYTASTGVLTLAGAASITNYRDALRSVEFSTSDSSASPADRTASFTVTDSTGATSAAAQRTINVSKAAAKPPTAVNQSYNAVGNTPLGVGTNPAGPAATVSGSLLTGDSDPDPTATLSVTANTQPTHGTVTVNPDGTFTYLPAAGYSGGDSFQYTIAGSNDPSQTATATVTITVGTLVWYTDDSRGTAGNGEASTPFNTLAAANSAAGANSIIFLYQGSGTYTGGVTLHSGEDLFGQPHGLGVGGYSLVTAGGSAPVITNGGGDGITLAQGADVEGVSVSSPSGNGITASSVNDATVGTANAVAVSGAGGDGIHVGGGNGALNFGSTSVTGSTGHSVSVASRSGGTVTVGGHITDSGTGVSLAGNTGATIAFTGTLTLSAGTHAAFTASGGGTVTATGTGSTLTTTTGSALAVQSTTIGAAGLTFQSISSNGANPGINLSSTGSSGGVTVTGTGTAGSGGTIQASTGNGITLSSTTAPSFTDMVIQNNAADGINGSQVSGLTLAASTVSGNGTQAAVSGNNDDGLDFSPNGTGSPNGLTGTVSITGSTVTGSADNNAIISDTSGTLGLTITGTTFSSDNSTTGNDGLHIDANGSTSATVSVTGSTFTNNFGDHFQFSTGSTATGTDSVTFSSNTLTSTAAGVLGGGVVISPFGNSHTTITVNGNSIQKPVGNGIGIDESGTSGTLDGTVHGNTVGASAVANSGGGVGIGIFAEGSVTETLAVTGNNLFQYSNPAGIHFLNREGNPAMNLTITGNTVASPGQFGSWGILGEDGAQSSDNGTVCAAITGNSVKGSAAAGQGGADIELDQNFATTVKLPGYTGGSSSTSAVQTFLQGNNAGNGTPSAIATVSGSGGGFTGSPGC